MGCGCQEAWLVEDEEVLGLEDEEGLEVRVRRVMRVMGRGWCDEGVG